MKLKRDELAATMALFSEAMQSPMAGPLLQKLTEDQLARLNQGLELFVLVRRETDLLEQHRREMLDATRNRDRCLPKIRRILRETRKEVRKVCHGDDQRLQRMGLDKGLPQNRSDECLLEQMRDMARRLAANRDLHQFQTRRRLFRLPASLVRNLENAISQLENQVGLCHSTRNQFHQQVQIVQRAESAMDHWLSRATLILRKLVQQHFPEQETTFLALFGFHIPITKSRETVRRYRERKNLIQKFQNSAHRPSEPLYLPQPQPPPLVPNEGLSSQLHLQEDPVQQEEHGRELNAAVFTNSLNRQTKPYSGRREPNRRRWGAGL